MISSHALSSLHLGAWRPIPPPLPGASTVSKLIFHAYMLMPGFSLAFHAETLGRSRTSISTYRERARQAALVDLAVGREVNVLLCALCAEHGLDMAQQRGAAQLPHWSRLAICEYRERGLSRQEIAHAFRCSRGTVASVLQGKGQGYHALSGLRILTAAQQSPAGRWVKKV